ncbi:hypothetical protein ACCE15_19200 [Pseudomonas parafulva]|uniref:hypothetical protein n=1 Tax=Pseudomonas parafulva TaxID=157782 RepID=UPI003568A1AC
MKLKNNNMLVAADFFEQTSKLYPESTDDYGLNMKSKALYADVVKQISAINDDFRFDFTSYPALTITDKDSNVLGFAVHPSLRKEHLAEYSCGAAVFNSAFENQKLFEQVRQAIDLAGGDVSGFSVRKDLGEFQESAQTMLRAVLNKSGNVTKYQYLNVLHLSDEDLAKNYQDYLEKEREDFRKKRENVVVMYGDKDKATDDLKAEHEQAKSNLANANSFVEKNTDPNAQADLNRKQQLAAEELRLKNEEVKRRLEQENVAAGKMLNWHEQAIKDKNFRLRTKPVYGDKYTNIQDVIVSDDNYNELYRFRAGLTANVRFTPAGLMNADARAIGQEYIIRRKVSPIKINLPDPDSNSGLSNAELMSFMKNSVIEFHKNWDVPFDKLRVPKAYQKEFDLLVAEITAKEALETGYGVDDPTPAPSPAAGPDPVQEKPPTPAPATESVSEPMQARSEPVPADPGSTPDKIENKPETAAPAVAEKVQDNPEPVADKVFESPVVDVPEPVVTVPEVKQVALAVSQGICLIESGRNPGKYIAWGKESFDHTPESVKKGIAGLCKHHGIQPSDVTGQFMTDDEKFTLNPKKSGYFKMGRAAIADLMKPPAPTPVEKPEGREVVIDDPEMFQGFNLDERETRIANSLNTPEILDSPEHHERQMILEDDIGEKVAEHLDNEDYDEAAFALFDEIANVVNQPVEEKPAAQTTNKKPKIFKNKEKL